MYVTLGGLKFYETKSTLVHAPFPFQFFFLLFKLLQCFYLRIYEKAFHLSINGNDAKKAIFSTKSLEYDLALHIFTIWDNCKTVKFVADCLNI